MNDAAALVVQHYYCYCLVSVVELKTIEMLMMVNRTSKMFAVWRVYIQLMILGLVAAVLVRFDVVVMVVQYYWC